MAYPPSPGGLPRQDTPLDTRPVFTEAYAVIPRTVMTDIVTSVWPGWQGARAWQLARPLSGFAETFAQAIVELTPGGGSDTPEPDPAGQSVVFVTEGALELTLDGQAHALRPGSYAYLPPGAEWRLRNGSDAKAVFSWIRKAYVAAPGLAAPEAFFTHEDDVAAMAMPETDGAWATKRFVEPDDLSHDMHVNIVEFQPGGRIPFPETHVMEHGLFILQGQGSYLLNTDWVEVEAGDFLWLRAFCPQACIAKGEEPFRYLLYKDVNRQVALTPFG